MTDRRTRASKADATSDRDIAAEAGGIEGLRVLKKYPNRRLYDTRTQRLHHAGRRQADGARTASTSWCATPRPATT